MENMDIIFLKNCYQEEEMNNKINQMSKMILRDSKINLYSLYEKQFNYFLNPESVRENMEEINMYHIPDSITEKNLKI